MRIDGLEAIALDIPLKRDFGGSTYHVLKRSTVITRLRTHDGLTSEVYNGDNRAHGAEIARIIRDELAPRIRGASIFESERIWETMFALTHAQRDRKILLEAIACVDCAIWDLLGKALGKSVRELLGGYRAELPIISIGGYYMEGKTLADIGREMEAYRQAGMAGCKFKVGGLAPEEDARRVEAARRTAGADFVLAVDANRGWSTHDAIRFATLIEPLDTVMTPFLIGGRLAHTVCHIGSRSGSAKHSTKVPCGTAASRCCAICGSSWWAICTPAA